MNAFPNFAMQSIFFCSTAILGFHVDHNFGDILAIRLGRLVEWFGRNKRRHRSRHFEQGVPGGMRDNNHELFTAQYIIIVWLFEFLLMGIGSMVPVQGNHLVPRTSARHRFERWQFSNVKHLSQSFDDAQRQKYTWKTENGEIYTRNIVIFTLLHVVIKRNSLPWIRKQIADKQTNK